MFRVCSCLQFAIHAVGDPIEIRELLGADSPHAEARCPECKKQLQRASCIDPDLHARVASVLRDLTPHEAHLVLEGMGFPEERDCVADVVRSVMNQKVRSIDAHTVRGTARTVIESITMEDGTTLFLSGTGWGALVYRIRVPKPFVSKELPNV